MGKVKGKKLIDKYYIRAKEKGYRSRASWKLVQLDSRFSFLSSSRAVLDLCAAPGSWMQVAVDRVPVGSLVLGLDLVPIAPIPRALSLQQDITKPECKAKIQRIMAERGVSAFDLILHDGSPNIGGAWAQEAVVQNALVIDSVKLATQLLRPKGTFVTKVFRSRDYSSVLYCLKQLFEKVEVHKPAASRSESAEIYVLGLRYKAPAKIDPRLLDMRHLFQGSIEPPKVVDVMREEKKKRHRGGYEDGVTLVRKECSATDFVWSDSPLEILGSVTSITFNDSAASPIKDHNLTTEEIKTLCSDLGVLGKQDFKHLLKWRMHIRKALSPSEKVIPSVPEDSKENEDEDEDKLLNEMETLTSAMERKKKWAKKQLVKRRAKDKARKENGMQIDAMEDGYIDTSLFSLSSLKGEKDLIAVDSTEYNGGYDLEEVGEDDENPKEKDEDSPSDVDSDEERQRYDKRVEEIFDQVYEQYLTKKDGSTKQRKRAKQAYSEALEGGDGDGDRDEMILSDHDSDKELDHVKANPLIVPLDEREMPTQEEITKQWFHQEIFAEAMEEGDLGKLESEDEMENRQEEHSGSKKANARAGREKKLSLPEKTKESIEVRAQAHTSKVDNDFEIVPAPATDSSDDSSSESSEEDDDTKAEILAYAKKMLRKKQREQILDDAYGRYMFDDEGLPKWFVEEERRHRQPMKPVTKEEVDAMRAQFREINARPAKKVAQAKARKKIIAMRNLEKVRKKANSISDQVDLPDRSKSKLIEKLYKKAAPKKPRKEYVVAKKGVQVKPGKGKVLVDRRMKKDSRSRGTGIRGKGASKKERNAKDRKGKGFAKTSSSGRKGNRRK